MTRSRTATAAVALGLTGALGLAACGGDTDATASEPTPSTTATAAPSPTTMHEMPMGDSSATPANEMNGATETTFTLLDTAPAGSDEVNGSAWLAQGEHGTTLTVMLTGLTPGADYVGHLHALTCSDSNGGPHFKFDPDGSDEPPNEVHLGFTADAEGLGMVTVTNEQQVGDGAKSVIVHPSAAMKSRLACADF